MKTSTPLVAFLLLSAAAVSTAGAQTCAAPTVMISSGPINGDTTNGDTTIGSVCGGITLTGPVDVYTFTNGGGTISGNLFVTPTSATFDVGLALGDGASCAAATGTCDGAADNVPGGGGAGAEAISLNALALNKTYFLFISSFASGGSTVTSGPYNLAPGTLPIKLQSFSID